MAGRNLSLSDVSCFRLSSAQLRNHEIGYFPPSIVGRACDDFGWHFFVLVANIVQYCLKNSIYDDVSSLKGQCRPVSYYVCC